LNTFPNLPQNPEPPPVGRQRRLTRWQRIALWTLVVLAGLTAVVVISIATLLQNQRFHEYALIKARQSASESLGVHVELQNYALHFNGISPTIDLYGLVVHGAAPYTNPPLLQVEQARVGVRVVSLLRQAWYLSEVTVHHPVVQIRVDANGNNNLPKPQKTSSTSNGVQPLFDLAIRRVALDGGEIYYNDRESALDADLRELTLNAGFDPERKVYGGQIAYSSGHLKSGGYEPIPHALKAEFEMSPAHLDLRKAELRSGASVIAFTAAVDDYSNPRVATVYHASVDSTELRRLLHNAELPLGVLELDGHAEYAAKPNQPALNSATLNGTLRSERLEFRTPTGRTEARAIRASYSLMNGDAEVHSLTASLLGGTLDAKATVRNLTGEQLGAAHLKLDGISLAALKQLANANAANDITLGGTLQAAGDASWKGSPQNLLATADATLDATAGSPQSTNSIPITGEIHASFRNREQQLTLRQSYLRTPRTTVTLDGSVGQHSQMNLALNAGDLHELETIAGIFSKPAQPFGLYGSATFTGALSGSASAPRLIGVLSGANLQVRGTEWKLLQAHLDAGPSSAEIQGGQLQPATSAPAPKGATPGNITFSGQVGLKHWAFAQSSPFQLTLNAQKLDAAQLARLAGSTTAVTGTFNAEVQTHGTELNPIGQGRLELLRATVAGEPIQSVVVQFNADGNAAHANLNVTMPAGVTTGVLTYYPKQHGYEVQLEAHDFKLDQLHAVKGHSLSIAGVMNLVANGRGTLSDPQLTASIEIPQLRAQGQTIDHLALQADVARHVATVSLDTRAVNANIRGRATVQLTDDYVADAVLDTQPIPLQPLVATYAPAQAENVSGQTELHATLRGPLKRRESIEAHLVIPELSVHYQKSIDLAVSGPIHADYLNGVLTLQRSGLKGTGTDLQFQGSLPLLDRTKPVALLLLGSVDLRLAELFDPDVTSSGQLRFNINSYGARSDPNFQGDVQIVNANFATTDAPVGLSNGNGTLSLTRDRLNITNFEGTVGGGKVTARGGVAYHPSMQFDVALAGQGVRLLYPDGMREGLSANLTLTGTPEEAVLRGQVNVDHLSFAPDFDLSNLTSLSGGVEEPPSRGFASNLQLNITVRSTQNVNLVSRTMSVSGTANLRVSGTAAQPVLLGRINLTGGDLLLQGNRYVLQSGVIDFVNPSRTEPTVNASITATIQQYNIGMRFEGPLERLRTSYSSDPALPPADIINLIAFGKTNESQAAAATSTNLTAEQSIASAVSGQVTGRVEKLAGISHLSVDPTLGNSQQNAGATVTVQQRVTSKILVTFSTDVTSTQRQVIQLEYQATPQVSLSGTRDQNGGFGFDTRITRDW
jgi:translocation and assembly module TamB